MHLYVFDGFQAQALTSKQHYERAESLINIYTKEHTWNVHLGVQLANIYGLQKYHTKVVFILDICRAMYWLKY